MHRKEFIQNSLKITGGLAAGAALLANTNNPKSVIQPTTKKKKKKQETLAITMWDFSWLERRWPGAGYEDYDKILDELVERGYDAVRIDVYPHLIYNDPYKEYELVPHWNTHDWGSPDYIKISVEPYLTEFVSKCKERDVKVALSSWWREDTGRSYDVITTPEMLAKVWLSVLDLLSERGLLDTVAYVDLTNEWSIDEWTPYKKGLGGWASDDSIFWMRTSIELLKEKYPDLKYTFSFTGEVTEQTKHWGDITMLDCLDQHIWMVNYNNEEFYNEIDYHYESFDPVGYQKIAKYGERLYREKPEYWIEGLKEQIRYAAEWSEHSKKPLITTECWGLVTYKDWPKLNWNWILDLCEIGTREAAATGRWVAISTSNFCGPQFVGMWREVEWHKKLTDIIHNSKIDPQVKESFFS